MHNETVVRRAGDQAFEFGFTSQSFTAADEERRTLIAETRGLDDLDPEALEVIEWRGTKYFAHQSDGSLWTQTDRHAAGVAGRANVRVVLEGRPPTPRYLIRARNPATLAQLEQLQHNREQAVERGRKQADEQRKQRRAVARPVVAADLDRRCPRSLREAAQRVEDADGQTRITDGRVVVTLPPSAIAGTTYGPHPAVRAAELLYRSEAELLTVRPGRGGRVDPAQLPDTDLLPSGRSLP